MLFDWITYDKAKRQNLRLLIGIQFGVMGFIVRIGLYY